MKAENLTPKEERRLRVFLEKKKNLDATPQQKCKNPKCDKMIPIPTVFCSSICWRAYYNTYEKINERAKELYKEAKEIRKQVEKLEAQRELAKIANKKLKKKMKEFNEVFK